VLDVASSSPSGKETLLPNRKAPVLSVTEPAGLALFILEKTCGEFSGGADRVDFHRSGFLACEQAACERPQSAWSPPH